MLAECLRVDGATTRLANSLLKAETLGESLVETPETHYARSGDVNIAYQVLGDGPFDLVFVPGSISHVELVWQVPAWAAFNRRLASFSRLILLDKRGTGMSDRVPGAPMLETRMDDVRAVMDAVGSERAAVLGLSEGGSMSALFAATYPDRTSALVLCGAPPRMMWTPDYPWGWTEEDYRRACEEEDRRWGEPAFMKEVVRGFAPSLDDKNVEALATLFRQTASPGAWTALNLMNMEIDVRPILSAIRVPTLVLNRAGEAATLRDGSRFMARHIPGARHVEFPGTDHAPFSGDVDSYVGELQRFLNETWAERAWEETEPDRVLATVLFTDIVGSTAKAAELGDARWRELLSQHDALIRRQLVRFRGTELDTAGDGFFASFDGRATGREMHQCAGMNP
jgi:pimeloyl-ACP methyl ester carboxylesterase